MANRISDPVITRRNDVVPGDKQDQPADGQTSTVSFTDGTSINWWDAVQHYLLRAADDLGRVGALANRPSAGADEPVWWLVSSGSDAAPYWTYNDGSQWLVMDGFPDGVEVGENPTETISSSGDTLSFQGNAARDVHLYTDVTLENTSGSDATEDVTVTLYDGTDNTGTQLQTDTNSVTVVASSTFTATFLGTDLSLDGGDYFIDVTFSGSTLSVDSLDEATAGATYRLDDDIDGTGRLRDRRRGADILTIDPLTGEVDFPNGATGTTDSLATGEVTLSSGSATVDTGVSTSTASDYFVDVAVRPENGADIAVSLEDDSGGAGNWVIHVEENSTSVGNPTVGWKLHRV